MFLSWATYSAIRPRKAKAVNAGKPITEHSPKFQEGWKRGVKERQKENRKARAKVALYGGLLGACLSLSILGIVLAAS